MNFIFGKISEIFTEKILKFLIFTIILGFLPIVFNLLRCVLKSDFLTIKTLVPNGELFLIYVICLGSSLGELILTNNKHRKKILTFGGANIFFLIVCSFLFAEISNSQLIIKNMPDNDYILLLGVMFITSIMISISCILLAGVEDND